MTRRYVKLGDLTVVLTCKKCNTDVELTFETWDIMRTSGHQLMCVAGRNELTVEARVGIPALPALKEVGNEV